jgi:hypothetical protein
MVLNPWTPLAIRLPYTADILRFKVYPQFKVHFQRSQVSDLSVTFPPLQVFLSSLFKSTVPERNHNEGFIVWYVFYLPQQTALLATSTLCFHDPKRHCNDSIVCRRIVWLSRITLLAGGLSSVNDRNCGITHAVSLLYIMQHTFYFIWHQTYIQLTKMSVKMSLIYIYYVWLHVSASQGHLQATHFDGIYCTMPAFVHSTHCCTS